MHSGHVVSGGMALRANQTYGRFVVRVRTEPDASGTTNGVVLTWPQSNDFPVDGESDMYETGPNPTRNFFSTHIHYSARNRQVSFRTHVDATHWHTIVMDWTASRIAVYDDGGLVASTSSPAVIPHVPQHLCLQLDAANAGRLARPVHMYVDRVKVYAFS
jgi:beta-glucanase (GH16 family)